MPDTTVAPDRPCARAVRLLATPALLLVALAGWVGLSANGIPSLACSLIMSAVMVGGLVLLEVLAPRPGLPPRPTHTLGSDVCFTATTAAAGVILPYLLLVPLGHAAGVHLGTARAWPRGGPWGVHAISCVLVADLTSYWWHRLQHTTGSSWLWRLHSVHHTPRHFDVWMGGRVHPLDVLGFTLVTYTLLAVLGAPVIAIEMTAFFASMVGAVHHTRSDTDCGRLNRVVPFADQHILHHSALESDAGNYGNITTLFDQLFGTYRRPGPRQRVPLGAWSLAPDYPQGDYLFQLCTPFGGFWRSANAAGATGLRSAVR